MDEFDKRKACAYVLDLQEYNRGGEDELLEKSDGKHVRNTHTHTVDECVSGRYSQKRQDSFKLEPLIQMNVNQI